MKRKTPSDSSDVEEKRGRSFNGADDGDNSPTESQHRVCKSLYSRALISSSVPMMIVNYCKTNFNIALHFNILKCISGWSWTWTGRGEAEMLYLFVASRSTTVLPFPRQCQGLTRNPVLLGLPKRKLYCCFQQTRLSCQTKKFTVF